SATPQRRPPTWWLRPIIGKDHHPAHSRWTGQWPIQLLRELMKRGVNPEGIRLSRQGNGMWLSGVEGTAIARAARASHLEGAFRATPDAALYRLGPVKDPSELTP